MFPPRPTSTWKTWYAWCNIFPIVLPVSQFVCRRCILRLRDSMLGFGSAHHVYILYSLFYQMKYILSPCTICLPRILRRQIPFRLFQHMFRYLWITVLQKRLVLLYLNITLSICLPHQLHHLPLAPYISWLTLIVYILTQHVNSPCRWLQFLAIKKDVEPFKLHPTSMSYIY